MTDSQNNQQGDSTVKFIEETPEESKAIESLAAKWAAYYDSTFAFRTQPTLAGVIRAAIREARTLLSQQPAPPKEVEDSPRYRLWKFFHDEHKLTLTVSELDEIILQVEKLTQESIPAYKFTPAPPRDRRKMILGDDSQP